MIGGDGMENTEVFPRARISKYRIDRFPDFPDLIVLRLLFQLHSEGPKGLVPTEQVTYSIALKEEEAATLASALTATLPIASEDDL